MDVYLIRHGETDGNRAWRHQHPDTALNENGRAQAARVIEAVIALRPTHLLTSTNVRAVETARTIALATDLVPATHRAFEELRRPTQLYGHHFVGLTTLSYIVRWFYGAKDGDGESYREFIARLHEARTHLEALPPDARVVVVSHSVFINMFVEHRCRPKPLSLPQAMWRFLKILRHKNTGITHLRYESGAGKCSWQLLRYDNGVHQKA